MDVTAAAVTAVATESAVDVTATTRALRSSPTALSTRFASSANATSTSESELYTTTNLNVVTATATTFATANTTTTNQIHRGQPISRTSSTAQSTVVVTQAVAVASSSGQDSRSTSDNAQLLATSSISAIDAATSVTIESTDAQMNTAQASQASQSIAGGNAQRTSETLGGNTQILSQSATVITTHGAGIFSITSASDAAGTTSPNTTSSGSFPALAIVAIVAVFALAILFVIQQTRKRKHRRTKRIDEVNSSSAWMRAGKRPPPAGGHLNSGYLGDSERATRGDATSSDSDSDGDAPDAYSREPGFLSGFDGPAGVAPTGAPVIVSSTIPALNALAAKGRSQHRVDDSDGPPIPAALGMLERNSVLAADYFDEEAQSHWSYGMLHRDSSRLHAQVIHTVSISDMPSPSAAVGFVNVEMLPDFLDLEGSVAVFSDSGGN
ncbi:hypothetical protein HDU82_001349 [Entophlyctis luteolus]|nr:hypothetical protein HDU82_001349 [Entophlyctis luteolus]